MSWAAVAAVFSLSPALQAQDVTVMGTPQETNERIKTLTMGKSNATHDYVIGSGDLLSVTVFDVPELTRDVRVSQSGTIGIPLVPVRLAVTGLTEFQAERKIAEVLEANGLVTHPEVGVMVREHKSKPITIVGAVAHPMVYEADRTVTLLEALAEAGGVSNDAGDTVIISRIPATNFVEVTDPKPIATPTAPGAGEPPAVAVTPEGPGTATKGSISLQCRNASKRCCSILEKSRCGGLSRPARSEHVHDQSERAFGNRGHAKQCHSPGGRRDHRSSRRDCVCARCRDSSRRFRYGK